ncbi:MAG: 30S ribosomal protein S6 [Parcubacteria group bacterium LiPW_39]|nr:MAG: 30S ribosomal protein S6 [Parcubacteria group bacterium LiPW_39]
MYELTYILTPLLEKVDLGAAVEKVRGFINGLGGEAKKEEISEKKKLAYPIKKQLYGFYVVSKFQLEPEKIEELEKRLRLENDILRFLILIQKEISLRQLKTKIIKPKRPALTPGETIKAEPKAARVKIEELDKKLEELLKE